MKRLFILVLISLFTGMNAQEGKNRFEESEQGGFERNVDHTNDQKADDPRRGPGGPGETVPIDNNIPLLLIAALGLIIYQARREKKVQ